MKKFTITLISVLAFFFLFVACSQSDDTTNNVETEKPTAGATTESATATITENSTIKPSTNPPDIVESPTIPITDNPIEDKTEVPTIEPTNNSTNKPTNKPTVKPTIKPTAKPTETLNPQRTPDIGDTEIVGSTTEADNAAKDIIKNSEKFNTTDNIFSALDDFWSDPEKFFLDEKYQASYPLILIDLDQKTNGAHNQIRKFYNNTAFFFSLNDPETDMILNYYKNIAFDRSLALKYGIGLWSVRTTNYSDDTVIWIDEATLYTPYYLLAGGVWGDKDPVYPKMLEEMSSVKKSDTFLAGCVASKPSHCSEYVPGFDPLVNLCARYGDEVKNLNNHELVFSTPIKSNTGFYDYYSGKIIDDYAIPFLDKTSNRFGIAYFTADNKLNGITIRR